MPTKLKFKIKNWKLLLLGLVLASLFACLGLWQLSRATQKQRLLHSYAERTEQTPYSGKDLTNVNDWRFYRAQLSGKFDNDHTILLDNKTFRGKIGYEVYTPFHADGLPQRILIDRGFIPMGVGRSELPKIIPINGNVTVIGMINVPPLYHALGKMADAPKAAWPLRVEFINLPQLATVLDDKLFPYVLQIDPKDPRAFTSEWQIVTMSPDKHMGYAVQWFALAATLLILSLALNRAK